MPKYVLKYKRERCEHIYKRSVPNGPKKGDQCTRHARIDRDGHYRCFQHKFRYYIVKSHDRIRRKVATQMKMLAAQLESLQKTEERYGFSTPMPKQLNTSSSTS
jgi:hypothetical protein